MVVGKPPHRICVPLRWLMLGGMLIALCGIAIVATKEGFGGPAPTVLQSHAIARVGIGVFCGGLAVTLGSVGALFVIERRTSKD